MDMKTGRANHIEDVLVDLHKKHQWFGWSDSKNKIYSNIIIHPKIWNPDYTGDGHEEGLMDNPYSIPTEKSLTDALAKLQSDFDAQEYSRNRKVEYRSLNQLELISDDSINSTTTHKDAIVAIKTKWPKDNSGPV